MIEWIFWIVAALWMVEAHTAALIIGVYLKRLRIQEEQWSDVTAEKQRQVALILPVKGSDPETTPAFFESILNQEYTRYRVLLAVESADDPVVPWLSERFGITPETEKWQPEQSNGLAEVKLIVAGPCENCGQKVHNQLAAFKLLEPEDEIVAFADADMLCGRDWLARLVAPINGGTHAVTTTYRWLIPQRANLANLFASVINASVATAGGNERWNLLWGGSMAIQRSDFDELDVPGHFAGSVNDDLRLTKLVRPAGRLPVFIHSLVVPTPIDFDWAKFWEFGHRQYVQVRYFGPIIYRVSLIVTGLYTLGFLSAIGAFIAGYELGLLPLVYVTFWDQWRALFRRMIYRQLFDGKTVKLISRTALLECLGTPLWMGLHFILAASALFTDRIRWAGIEYRIVSRSETEVLGRNEPG